MCSAPTAIQSSNSSSGVNLPTQMAEGGPRNKNGHHLVDCSDDDLESSSVICFFIFNCHILCLFHRYIVCERMRGCNVILCSCLKRFNGFANF